MKKVPGASHGAPYLPQALGQCPSFQMVSPPLGVSTLRKECTVWICDRYMNWVQAQTP
ncbi:unnamed protein product [Staurois parvus]|uniref:Uncharacterized protein n=1 Tax=Staurois parvus TaxID=386267 RepID=A0ABN9CQB1_9NEOB|nr:unnamed protein product [Staurois parvus]